MIDCSATDRIPGSLPGPDYTENGLLGDNYGSHNFANVCHCAESGFDVSSQIGPNPVLPDHVCRSCPNMKLDEVVGWQEGRNADVPTGSL
ncbi:hypothetical protein [Sulfitobacter indolifex]|uniref:hypothetical protein n=1 Tax=Sulfitobacter indolifex TaxID=225422 RepID=UPI001FCB18D6|nr:hypothetical protein [Sulfitobacter indolifex]